MQIYNISKEVLYKKYIEESKTISQICKEIGCSRGLIHRYLHRFKIVVRPYGSWKIWNKGLTLENSKIKAKCLKQGITLKNKLARDPQLKQKYLDLLKKANKCLLRKKNKFEYSIESLLPKEYKYVGDGKFWIEKFNPDFININGQKKIIEAYGDYWHNLPNYKIRDIKRLETYKQYGYDTLIIWQHELEDLDILKHKINSFIKK